MIRCHQQYEVVRAATCGRLEHLLHRIHFCAGIIFLDPVTNLLVAEATAWFVLANIPAMWTMRSCSEARLEDLA